MWILYAGPPHVDGLSIVKESSSNGSADPQSYRRQYVPLHRIPEYFEGNPSGRGTYEFRCDGETK